MRAIKLLGSSLLLAVLSAGPACEESPPPATPAAMAPSAQPSAAPPPSVAAPSAQPAPIASAPAAPAPPAGPAPPAEQGEAEEHRHHHHAGVFGLIAMSLHDLDLSDDQKAKVEKIRADAAAKMEPARAADQDLANLLADGVAAGTVDRAKADAAIDQLVTKVKASRASLLDAVNQLHAVLTPAQRATLADKVQEHFEKWKEANGHEDQEGQHRSGPMLALVRDLNLSQAEADQIKANFRSSLKASSPKAGQPNVQDHEHKEVVEHLKAFAAAFKGATFDAKKVGATGADWHMAKWGATRMARFLEAAAPVLTPEQRTKLSQTIKERAGHQPT